VADWVKEEYQGRKHDPGCDENWDQPGRVTFAAWGESHSSNPPRTDSVQTVHP